MYTPVIVTNEAPTLQPLLCEIQQNAARCGTLREKPRPGLWKALWRNTGPSHHFGASGSLQMGSRVPDSVQTSGFHPVKIWKDTFQMETLRRAMSLSSPLPHRLLVCTGKLSSCVQCPQEPWIAQDILGHGLCRRDHLWTRPGMHRRQTTPHSEKYLRSSQRPQHKGQGD